MDIQKPSPGVEKSIYQILDLFKDKIYNPVRQRYDIFFDNDYHSLINLTSFGHDIETAWLMDRTCEIISDKSYQQMLTQITNTLTTAVYNSAYDFENHGLFNEKENNTTDQQKKWWIKKAANGLKVSVRIIQLIMKKEWHMLGSAHTTTAVCASK